VVTKAGKLSLSVLESNLLASKIVAASINKSLSILNSLLGSLQVTLKTLELVVLVTSLSGLHVIKLLVSLDLSPHLSSLDFDHLNFFFQVSDLGSQVSILVALRDVVITKTSSLEELLVQQSFGSLHLIGQIVVLVGLFLEQVLEVFELLAVVSNFVHTTVKSGTVLDFRS